MSIKIEEYFRYHPPTTPERVARHERINNASLQLALSLEAAEAALVEFWKAIDSTVTDEHCRKWAFQSLDPLAALLISKEYLFQIQQARMFANQGITVDELEKGRQP